VLEIIRAKEAGNIAMVAEYKPNKWRKYEQCTVGKQQNFQEEGKVI
jgi:hypothetical protein